LKALVPYKKGNGMDLHYEETKNQGIKKRRVRIKLHFAGLIIGFIYQLLQHDENAEPLIIGLME